MQKDDFKTLFRMLEHSGIPNPEKDPEFRKALIEALQEIEQETASKSEEADNSVTEFKFNIEEYEECIKILNRTTSSPNALNRATNYIIDSWKSGNVVI